MPNPGGSNQFSTGSSYGEKSHIERMLKEAKGMAQGTTSAINAPKRAQRKAVRGEKDTAQPTRPAGMDRPVQASQVQPPPPDPQLPPDVQAAAWWAEVALLPGVTPVAQELADAAQGVISAAP